MPSLEEKLREKAGGADNPQAEAKEVASVNPKKITLEQLTEVVHIIGHICIANQAVIKEAILPAMDKFLKEHGEMYAAHSAANMPSEPAQPAPTESEPAAPPAPPTIQ